MKKPKSLIPAESGKIVDRAYWAFEYHFRLARMRKLIVREIHERDGKDLGVLLTAERRLDKLFVEAVASIPEVA